MFRDEYIFELDRAIVVETPQLGNATYLLAKPESMDRFLVGYAQVSKDDIRSNRRNIGEKLGFLGRIIHGSNPRRWATELRAASRGNAGVPQQSNYGNGLIPLRIDDEYTVAKFCKALI